MVLAIDPPTLLFIVILTLSFSRLSFRRSNWCVSSLSTDVRWPARNARTSIMVSFTGWRQ